MYLRTLYDLPPLKVGEHMSAFGIQDTSTSAWMCACTHRCCQHGQIWHNSTIYGGERGDTTESRRYSVSVSEKDESHNSSNVFQGADEGPWPMPPFYLVTLICVLSTLVSNVSLYCVWHIQWQAYHLDYTMPQSVQAVPIVVDNSSDSTHHLLRYGKL